MSETAPTPGREMTRETTPEQIRLNQKLAVLCILYATRDVPPAEKTAAFDDFNAELARLVEDAERLDWLNGRLNWFTTQGPGHDPHYANIRERIDAARPMAAKMAAARQAMNDAPEPT